MIFPLLFLAAIGLQSCKKCADCKCEGATEFTFSDSISTANKDLVQTTYNTDFDKNYPEDSQELCEKRGDYDDAVAAYTEKSNSYEENQKIGGFPWSLKATYDCTCTEQ